MDSGAIAGQRIYRRLDLYKLMKQEFAVCFSGHRPEKLPTGTPLRMLQSLLFHEIEAAIKDGATTFYTGMARGVDLWAADMVLYFRQQYPSVKLICVLPFSDRIHSVRGAERFHVNSILESADRVVSLREHYCRGCYQERNAYMVAHSRRIIALVADGRSGTGQTVQMAKRAGLELRVLSIEDAVSQNHPSHDYFNFQSMI